MLNRRGFARQLADLNLPHVERAVAFLYYYRETQEFEERTAGELASDLHDEGFPKPNVTRLRDGLRRSRYTVRGSENNFFQIDLRRLSELENKYGQYLKTKKVDVSDSIIPNEWVVGTRPYIERMVYQINGSYEYAFYDACATLCRRLMESLIIEIYISEKRHHEIQKDGVFISLERLVKYVSNDSKILLGRNTPKTMYEVKQLGDTAAHDRTYITPQVDIDDLKARLRRMIAELLEKSGISNCT